MLVFVIVITILVLGGMVNWSRVIDHVSRWQRRRGGILDDAEAFARVRLPPGWRPTSGLNASATLQARHAFRERYLIVISESREDFPPTVDLNEHSARTVFQLAADYQLLAHTESRDVQVAGFRALQIELQMVANGTLITYLHTTVEGARAWHQVLGWATRSQYSREAFESLLEGFVELPGPAPRPLDVEMPASERLLSETTRRRIGF